MRKVTTWCLVLTLIAPGLAVDLRGAAQGIEQKGSALTGTVRRSNGQSPTGTTVQLRRYGSNFAVVGQASIDAGGAFVFEGLPPGRYMVEVIEGTKVVAMSSVLDLQPGMTLPVHLSVSGSGSLAGADRAGFSLFGLGPAATAAVLGAAGAAAVTAVVSTRSNASPSQ
jgi:hypothetical protein